MITRPWLCTEFAVLPCTRLYVFDIISVREYLIPSRAGGGWERGQCTLLRDICCLARARAQKNAPPVRRLEFY